MSHDTLINALNSELDTLEQVQQFNNNKTFMGHNTVELINAYQMVIASHLRQRATTEIIKERIL